MIHSDVHRRGSHLISISHCTENFRCLMRHVPLTTYVVPPSNHLEKLKGDLRSRYSIRVNRQWRLCFQWNGEEAVEVEFVDYHG